MSVLEPFSKRNKCSVVHYKTGLSPTFLNNKLIVSKYVEKDLGLNVSAGLKWRPHYQLITSKTYKMFVCCAEFSLDMCLFLLSAL